MPLDDSEFQRRFRAALGDMKKGAIKGVRLAAAHVKLEAQKRVPVDEGNLKGSAYTSVSIGSYGVVGEIGFTAFYAAYVHEAPMILQGLPRPTKGNFWDKQGQATNKFLEKAIDENHSEILEIIQRSTRL